jgi:hypothetical protein
MEQFAIDPTIAYDIVELPSRGIHYTTQKKSVKVAYLTASDENVLSAQNLIQSNTVVDELLKRKVLDRDISVDDLVDEDRQAILIFLRNTSFGSEFNVYVTDPKTNEGFTSKVDLSEVKFKEFTLTPNENGEFKFFMEKSKVDVTFKFLTKKQQKELEDIEKSWNGNGVAPLVTKELEMMIKSVKGNKEMMSIHNFIQNLPIKDSQDFRKFVKEHKPSLDLKKTVKTPSGEDIQVEIGFGVEFFRPFYGL